MFSRFSQNCEKRLLVSSFSFAMFFRPSVSVRGTNRLLLDGFSCNLVFEYLSNLPRERKFHSNRTRIKGTLHGDHQTFFTISRSIRRRKRTVLDEGCTECQNTHFVFTNFFFLENHAVYDTTWENIVKMGMPQMTIRRTRIACWIPKATNTHSEYVTLLFRCNSGCKNVPECYIIRTLRVLLAFI